MPRPTVTDMRLLAHAHHHPDTPTPRRVYPGKLLALGLLRPTRHGYTLTEAGHRAYIEQNLPAKRTCQGIVWARANPHAPVWVTFLPQGTYTLTKEPGLPHQWTLTGPDQTVLGHSPARALAIAAEDLTPALYADATHKDLS